MLLLSAVFLLCTALFFGILHSGADIGRDFALADLLNQGKVLYRDVRSLFGPEAPWFHHLLFRLFGPSVVCLLLAGTAAALAIALLSYLIARQVLPPGPAALCGVMIVVHSSYGPDPCAYATPYTFAATYGLLFTLLSLYAGLRALDADSLSRWDLTAATSAGLALAAKQDFAFISAVVLAATMALRLSRLRKQHFSVASAMEACYALAAAPFALVLWRQVGIAEFLDNVYPKRSFAAWRYFYEKAGGWGPDLWSSALKTTSGMLLNFSFVVWASCLIAVLIGAARGARFSSKPFWALLAAGALFVWRFPSLAYYPVLLHAVVLGFVLARRVPGSRQKIGLLTFAGAVFSFRILPLARDYGYGQLYYIPSLTIYIYLFYELVLPSLGRSFRLPQLRGAMAAVLIVSFVVPEFFAKSLLWASRAELIPSQRGYFRVEDSEAPAARLILDQVGRYTSPGEKILLLPVGAMYYFLSDRQQASKYLDYTNGQLADGAPEQEEIRRLSQLPPKLVVLRDIPEYAEFAGPVNTFGRAYNVEFARWIHENYAEVRPAPYQDRQVHFLIPNAALAASAAAP